MVWFYQFQCHLCWNCLIWTFNPTMVWFYPGRAPVTLSGNPPFNPTMVWFYPDDGTSLSAPVELSIPLWSDFIKLFGFSIGNQMIDFQSHYGLILSTWKSLLVHSGENLSIPLWSDFIKFNLPVLTKAPAMFIFQSHYGLILSGSKHPCTESNHSLSIPLWSDFIQHSAGNTRCTNTSAFNPTMVWFYL